MPTILSTDGAITTQFQRLIDRTLLERMEDYVVLKQFAKLSAIPRQAGNKGVTYHRLMESSGSRVELLTEGTLSTTWSPLTYDPITVDLKEFGEQSQTTNTMDEMALFNIITDITTVQSGDAGERYEEEMRNIIVNPPGTPAVPPKYHQFPGTLADFAALVAATGATSIATMDDYINSATYLKVNKARPMRNNNFIAVVSPQVASDIQKDPDWQAASHYAAPGSAQIYKGSLGIYAGLEFVESTLPFIESTAQGTYDAAGNIFSVLVFGANALGTVKLEGYTPWSPSIGVVRGRSHADPMARLLQVAWSGWWNAFLRNNKWVRVLRTKSAYV